MKQKRQKLPIAARPAVQPVEPCAHAARMPLVERNIVDKSCTGEQPLEQIVAEYAVVRQARARHGLAKGAHVDHALAAEAALARQILPQIGQRRGIAVHAARAAHRAHKAAFGRLACQLHLGGQHGIARPIDRQRQRAHQLMRRAGQHARARIQRDDIGIVFLGQTRGFRLLEGIFAPAEQLGQRVDRAALAFMRTKAALVRHGHALAREQAIFACSPTARVDGGNRTLRRVQYGLILGHNRVLRIGQIAQQDKRQHGIVLETPQRFQFLRQRLRAFGRRKQRRHDHQRAHVLAQPIELIAHQPPRTNQPGGGARKYHIQRAKQAGQRANRPPADMLSCKKSQYQRRYQQRRAIKARLRIRMHLRDAHNRHTHAAQQLRRALVGRQPPCDLAPKPLVVLGGDQRGGGKCVLADVGARGQHDDALAHLCARLLVHAGICTGRVLAQRLLRAAHGGKAAVPVDGREHSQRRERVVEPQPVERLDAALQRAELLGRPAALIQPALECRLLIGQLLLAQIVQRALEERAGTLRQAGRVQIAARLCPLRRRNPLAFSGHGALTRRQTGTHQHSRQRGRRSPELVHLQRTHLVERTEAGAQPPLVDGRIAVAHQLGQQALYARSAIFRRQ